MATMQYSDLFTYESLAFSKSDVVYSNVTLLKDICKKKAGTTHEEIHLNTTNGKFTVPRPKAPAALSTRSKTEIETAAKTLVEFKGKHTRFPDSDEDEDKCAPPLEKGESSARPNNISGMMGLKIYENKRRKLLRVESVGDLIARKIDEHFRKEMHAVKSDMNMGPRGDLTFTFQTSSMECIPEMKTLTEFIVDGCTYYYMRLV
jgi:hypothetical protein